MTNIWEICMNECKEYRDWFYNEEKRRPRAIYSLSDEAIEALENNGIDISQYRINQSEEDIYETERAKAEKSHLTTCQKPCCKSMSAYRGY